MHRYLIPLALAMLCATTSPANPTNEDPSKPLAAHGTIEGAKELVQSLYDLYNTELKVAIKSQEEQNNARLPFGSIAKASGKIWKGKRDAEHLKLMGEPAGYDLAFKLNLLGIEFKKLAMRYKASQPGNVLYTRLKKQLDSAKPRDAKKLDQTRDTFAAGGAREKLEATMNGLEADGIKLYEKLAFFSPTESKPYSPPFETVVAAGDSALTPLRRADYVDAAKAAIESNLAVLQVFQAEATRIRGEIAQAGMATLGEGVSGNVVQSFQHVAGLWGEASAAIARIAGLQWAFGSDNKTASELSAPARDKARELAVSAEKSLALLIDAAVATTPQAQVASTYSELLQQIATVDRRADGSRVANACQSSLAKLASKDTGLAGRIANYQKATSEVLAWRHRFALQQASELTKKYPPSINQMTRKESVTKTNKPKLFGGVPSSSRIVAPAVFSGPADWSVYQTGSLLLGNPVSEQKMNRLSPTSKTAVVPYSEYHFANVPVPMPSDSEVADLKTALLVGATSPPLTIEAADAISSAQLHDYEQVGGMIIRVHLESAVTRFASLKSAVYPLTTLGKIPVLSDEYKPLTQACWRLDITPHWAQNKYFVVTVPVRTQ